MASLQLNIVTPTKQVFSEDVEYLSVPTAAGVLGILPNHMPLVALLVEGEIKITTKKNEYFLAIGEGFMEVGRQNVQILVSRAFHADELNEADIKKAQNSAKEILSKKTQEIERREATALLRRSVLEMKVLSHRRTRSTRVPQSQPGSPS